MQLKRAQPPSPIVHKRERATAGFAKLPGSNVNTPLPVFDKEMQLVANDTILSSFRIVSKLGAGVYGEVYLAEVVNVQLKEYLIKTQGYGGYVALKIQEISSFGRTAEYLQAELAINQAFTRSGLSTLHFVRSLYWSRMLGPPFFSPPSQPEDVPYQVEVQEYANYGTLNYLLNNQLDLALRSWIVQPLSTRVARIHLIFASILAQLFVGLELLRALMPDFRHNDLHTNNVLLSTANVEWVVYSFSDSMDMYVPLHFTDGCVLKIADTGFSTGTYRDVNHTPHSLGTFDPEMVRSFDHKAVLLGIETLVRVSDREAFDTFAQTEAWKTIQFLKALETEPVSYAFLLTTQPLFFILFGTAAQDEILNYANIKYLSKITLHTSMPHSHVAIEEIKSSIRVVRMPQK